MSLAPDLELDLLGVLVLLDPGSCGKTKIVRFRVQSLMRNSSQLSNILLHSQNVQEASFRLQIKEVPKRNKKISA